MQIGNLTTQALQHREERQELMRSESGLVNELKLAIQSKRIFDADFTELQKALAYCMMLVGIKAANIPEEQDAAFLIGQIKKNYGGNKLSEIKLAFDLSAAGKLDIEEKEVIPYQDFTFLYFSRIFNSYRRWAASEVKQIVEKPVQRIYSLDEIRDQRRGDIEAYYQRCLKGIKPPETLPEYFLEQLKEDGMLSPESDDLHAFFSWYINNGIKNVYVRG